MEIAERMFFFVAGVISVPGVYAYTYRSESFEDAYVRVNHLTPHQEKAFRARVKYYNDHREEYEKWAKEEGLI